ncbi:MAG: hypothetical protein WD016_09430 [Balneolaceae bacterium]
MVIENWLGENVGICQSKGGVYAFQNPYDNLVRGDVNPWPSSEIVQKLYKSIHQNKFINEELEVLTSTLSYYSDLQSIHSEDAITWSIFGTASYLPAEDRNKFVHDFLNLSGLNPFAVKHSEISLWRRVPHPETLVPGGPEIDFLIQTSDTLVLGEAKWKSSIGIRQGKNKDRNQIQLRLDFLNNYGEKIYPGIKNFVVVELNLSNHLTEIKEMGNVKYSSISWEQVCQLTSHKYHEELQLYLSWKKQYSQNV